MYTRSYVSVKKSRQFLTAATSANSQQLSHQDYGHAVSTFSRTQNGESTFQRSGYLLTADPNVPFAEFLRNLSESLRKSANVYPLKAKMDSFPTNMEPETGQTEPDSSSSDDKEKHNIQIVSGNYLNMAGQKICQPIETRTKGENSKESTRGLQKNSRRYFIRDILKDETTNQTASYSRDISCRPVEPALPMPDFTFCGPVVPTYMDAAYQQQNQIAPWSFYDARNTYQEYSVWHCQRPHKMESVHRFSGIGFSPDDTQGRTFTSGYSSMTNSTHHSNSTTSNFNSRSCKDQRFNGLSKCSGPLNATQIPVGTPAFKSSLHKRYTCEVCHKAFSRSNTLLTHKRIHTGDKPFSCDVCGRAFRQPGNLTRHRLTHSTYKPFVCPVCRKAFNRASNLNTHVKTHPGYCTSYCTFLG